MCAMSLMLLSGSMARAQFSDYGVRLGLGPATIQDDLGIKSPTLGLNVGGYINFEFSHSQTVLAEIFYLQTGVNLLRRGGNFEDVFENENSMSIRNGHYYAWYAQVPVLAGLHFELPVRQPGHVVGVFVGPAVSYGLFGSFSDRKVSPGVASVGDNYDVDLYGTDDERKLFNHLNRLDVSAIVGVSYEYGPLTLSLMLDHGFLALSEGLDVLRMIDRLYSGSTEEVSVEIPNGNNHTVLLGVAYRLGSFKK